MSQFRPVFDADRHVVQRRAIVAQEHSRIRSTCWVRERGGALSPGESPYPDETERNRIDKARKRSPEWNFTSHPKAIAACPDVDRSAPLFGNRPRLASECPKDETYRCNKQARRSKAEDFHPVVGECDGNSRKSPGRGPPKVVEMHQVNSPSPACPAFISLV